MTKRRNHSHWRKPSRKRSGRQAPQRKYVLEQGSIEELIAQKERTQQLLKFHWDFYSELAYLRKQIEPEITLTLNQSSISNFKLKNWQRGVKYKYSLHPFSTVGSLSDPGDLTSALLHLKIFLSFRRSTSPPIKKQLFKRH